MKTGVLNRERITTKMADGYPSAPQRTARISWLTGPPEGTPRLSVGSASISALPLSLDQSARDPLTASPGELLAAATGSVLAWLIADELVADGARARELVVAVTLTGSEEPRGIPSGPFLTSIAFDVEGFVPGIDQEGLARVSRSALERCLQGLQFSDDLRVTLRASLLGA
jgi:hypothetical protein